MTSLRQSIGLSLLRLRENFVEKTFLAFDQVDGKKGEHESLGAFIFDLRRISMI